MKYRVRCKVSGGATGTRESYLKGADNEIQIFTDKQEAIDVAALLTEQMNDNQYRTATFEYTAEEVS